MATVVQLKRSETTGVIPAANDIAVGELAVNLADGALYTKRTDGSIIEIGVSEEVPVFFADEVDLGDLSGAGETYDMGGLDGSSPSEGGGGIQLSALSVTDAGGDGSLSYNDTTGVFTFTGPSATDVRAHFSASTGIDITDGAISTSITQYTDALARGAVSVTDSGGDGTLEYNSTTGVITYTGPSASDVRAHFSAGTGIGITDGAISTSITQYTDALARGAVSVTDSGGDGSLSYNDTTGVFTYTGPSASDVRAHFSAGTGISITDGEIETSITQYADSDARASISVTDSGGDGSLSYNNSTGVFTFTGPSASDVRAHFSASTGISITDGAISTSITQYTDALARSAISVTDSGGDGSLSYNSTTGVITYTGPSASDVRAHFSAGTGITLVDGAIATDTSVIATKQYVDEIAQGLQAKPAVEIATTANLTSTYNNGTSGVGATLTATSNGAFPEIDGITLTSTTLGENGVLVKNQTSPAQNGRYNLTQVGDASNPWILTKCGLCDEADEIAGAYVFVKRGTLYTGTGWVQTVSDPSTFTVGTDSILVTQFSGAGTYTAGAGLTLTGTEFSVDAAQTQITSVGTLSSLTVSGALSLGGTANDATLHITSALGGYNRLTQMSPDGTSLDAFNIMAAKDGGGSDMWWSWGVDTSNRWRINQGVGFANNGLIIDDVGQITSADVAAAVGYKGLPQNSQTSAYTLVLSDMGKHISITTGGVVIPANGTTAFPIGATIVVFNNSGSSQTISITTDTLRLAGTATTGSRTLAQYGLATLVKVTSTVWVATGNVT